MEKYQIPYPIGINNDVARAYSTYGLPDNYLFKADGSVAKHFIGYTREESLKPLIEDALLQVVTPPGKPPLNTQ